MEKFNQQETSHWTLGKVDVHTGNQYYCLMPDSH